MRLKNLKNYFIKTGLIVREFYRRFNKPKLAKLKWYEKVAEYLCIPYEEVIKSLGLKSGYTQKDKIIFSEKYDGGNRIITTINRKAELDGRWIEVWKDLKYIAIVQEFMGFKRINEIWYNILPLIKKLKYSDKLKILDYGCGTSIFGRLLLEKYPEVKLTLCDSDGYHFRFGLEECKKLSNLTKGIKITSIYELPKLDEKYDFIYCYTVLEHIPNSLQVLKYLCSYLRIGGIFLESYGGKTGDDPVDNSADSIQAWNQRDDCFDYLYSLKDLVQISGEIIEKSNDSHYPESGRYRVWQLKG